MSFWKNVVIELEYKQISKKDFAKMVNLPIDTIMKGISRQSIPQIDTAFRIAKVLDVSLEYLMQNEEYKEFMSENVVFEQNHQIQLYRKYSEIIENLEKLDEKRTKAISTLIENMVNFD